MEQIQIIAALKGNISDEERKRLELQLALATGNVEEAQKLTYQLAIAQGLSVKLAQDLASLPAASNPFAAWKGYLDEIELQAKRIAGLTGGGGGGGGGSSVPSNIPSSNVVPLPTAADVARLASPRGAGASTIGDYLNVVVKINEKEIASSVQNQNNSGNFTGFSRLGDFRTL